MADRQLTGAGRHHQRRISQLASACTVRTTAWGPAPNTAGPASARCTETSSWTASLRCQDAFLKQLSAGPFQAVGGRDRNVLRTQLQGPESSATAPFPAAGSRRGEPKRHARGCAQASSLLHPGPTCRYACFEQHDRRTWALCVSQPTLPHSMIGWRVDRGLLLRTLIELPLEFFGVPNCRLCRLSAPRRSLLGRGSGAHATCIAMLMSARRCG